MQPMTRTEIAEALELVANSDVCKGNHILGAILLIASSQLKNDDAELTAINGQLAEVLSVASESHGIAGFHLNGEIAHWEELFEWMQ